MAIPRCHGFVFRVPCAILCTGSSPAAGWWDVVGDAQLVEEGWGRPLPGPASCLPHPVPLSPRGSPSPIHPALQGFGDWEGDDGFPT